MSLKVSTGFGIVGTAASGLLLGALLATLISACASSSAQTSERSVSAVENEDSPSVTPDKPFDWPVDSARMTRGFLPNRRRPHLGIDLAAPKGTPIYAAHDGTVIYAGKDFRGYGRMVLIEGSRGWASLYAHFSKIDVREGQKIKQGEQVGLMGRTGRATGVHLHFELRRAKGPIDPLPYLPGGTRLANR